METRVCDAAAACKTRRLGREREKSAELPICLASFHHSAHHVRRQRIWSRPPPDRMRCLNVITIIIIPSAQRNGSNRGLLLLWFMFSSCLGDPIRRAASLWLESAIETARMQQGQQRPTGGRRRGGLGNEGELWEMEYRNRTA